MSKRRELRSDIVTFPPALVPETHSLELRYPDAMANGQVQSAIARFGVVLGMRPVPEATVQMAAAVVAISLRMTGVPPEGTVIVVKHLLRQGGVFPRTNNTPPGDTLFERAVEACIDAYFVEEVRARDASA